MIRSRRMGLAGYLAHIGEMMNTYNIFIGKSEWKRLLGRDRCRWEVNIRMGLREIVWEVVDWIHVAQDKDQRRVLCRCCGKMCDPVRLVLTTSQHTLTRYAGLPMNMSTPSPVCYISNTGKSVNVEVRTSLFM
jgi:hypothetical protein